MFFICVTIVNSKLDNYKIITNGWVQQTGTIASNTSFDLTFNDAKINAKTDIPLVTRYISGISISFISERTFVNDGSVTANVHSSGSNSGNAVIGFWIVVLRKI